MTPHTIRCFTLLLCLPFTFLQLLGCSETDAAKISEKQNTAVKNVNQQTSIVGKWDCITQNPNGNPQTNDMFLFTNDNLFESHNKNGLFMKGKYKKLSNEVIRADATYIPSMADAGQSPYFEEGVLGVKFVIKKVTPNKLNMTSQIFNNGKLSEIIRGESCSKQLAIKHMDEYVGEFKNGKYHGDGSIILVNGNKYVGEFKDGELHGKGTMIKPDGRKYVGEWKNGERSGTGTYTWPDGDKYVGEWKNGKQNGTGTQTFPRTGQEYVGEWKDGKFHGRGTMTEKDGRVKNGVWADNVITEYIISTVR